MSAAGVTVCTAPNHGAGAGSIPSAALHTFGPKDITVRPIQPVVARQLCEKHHYLASYPGGSLLNYGVFVHSLLLGVAVIGSGPSNICRFFRGSRKDEVVCLSRLWLDDRLGRNAESRVLGIILRSLKRHTGIKAVVAYSDPAQNHQGIVYKAAGFHFLGESSNMPLYRLPDGSLHHSRSLSHAFGTHSINYFAVQGINVKLEPQTRKLIYVGLIDPTWQERLTRPTLPYPRKETTP